MRGKQEERMYSQTATEDISLCVSFSISNLGPNLCAVVAKSVHAGTLGVNNKRPALPSR